LKCPERNRWREEFLNRKRLHINEEIALRKTVTVNKVTEQKIEAPSPTILNSNGKTRLIK
jgi:hypothetical protein